MNREELNQLTHDVFGRYTLMDVHDFMGTEVAVVLCKTGCFYLKSRWVVTYCTDIDPQVYTRLPIQTSGEVFQERHHGLFVHMDWYTFSRALRRIRPILIPGVHRRYFSYMIRSKADEYTHYDKRNQFLLRNDLESRDKSRMKPFAAWPRGGWF